MQYRVYGVWVCSLLFSVLPHSEKHQQGVTFRDVLLLEVCASLIKLLEAHRWVWC
jgi:hypothetical protein